MVASNFIYTGNRDRCAVLTHHTLYPISACVVTNSQLAKNNIIQVPPHPQKENLKFRESNTVMPM